MSRSSFPPVFLCLAAVILTGCASPANGLTSGTPAAKATIPAGDFDRRLTVAGMERSYLLHIPSGIPAGSSLPLVFIFHGMSEDGAYISAASGFNEISDANGFLLVYPDGSAPPGPLSWNAGGCCGSAHENRIDEPAFIRAILADLAQTSAIDPKRVYATGFSNGAMLSYRLGCEMSDIFAAVAPVAGILAFSLCLPPEPVSVLHIHGSNDVSVPIMGGGTNPSSGLPFPSIIRTIAYWVRLDGCTDSPHVEQSGIVLHTSYASCRNGSAVELYVIKGMGHNWPPSSVLPASQVIWEFFAAHPKP